MTRINSIEAFQAAAREARRQHEKSIRSIRVGMASCGLAAGAGRLYERARQWRNNGGKGFTVDRVGCRGYCPAEPVVEVVTPNCHLIFDRITVEQMEPILAAAETGDFRALERDRSMWQDSRAFQADGLPLFTRDGYPGRVAEFSSIPFFKPQRKIITRNCGLTDPFNIAESLARGGYAALASVLTQNDPEKVIQAVIDSGLRGLGGAGFPTGRKWRLARSTPADEKYVFVNADEGDPGAFMDRLILESDPHAVLEGLAIGAFAIGARRGVVYIRDEYPRAVETLDHAIGQARGYGLLGEKILGTAFDFDVSVKIGAGAFVCGEETALISSAEGKMGRPDPRPPFPAQSGYRAKPTNINNVKTWAAVPPILRHGSDWFAGIGLGPCAGTAVFCISGDVKHTGLAEVAFGTPLADVVFGIAGGPADDRRKIKAVQLGGPCGGILPRERFDLPVDFEPLARAGAPMGSGSMVVVDDTTCMVEMTAFLIGFVVDESCGKCTPCREGSQRMHEILQRIMSGAGSQEDLRSLEDLAEYMKDTALCGLGTSAPGPLVSALRYFRDEFEAHVRQNKCPAGCCFA